MVARPFTFHARDFRDRKTALCGATVKVTGRSRDLFARPALVSCPGCLALISAQVE